MLAVRQPFVTEVLTRQSAKFEEDVQATSKQRADLSYGDIERLAFSFKGLVRIDNLPGLSKLRELRLDNNDITKIENLSHLVTLTRLDLSFNKISVIENLQGLTRLEDLSLYHNNISVCENLEALVSLKCLSLGANRIQDLRNILYLRKITSLCVLTLTGNPLSENPSFQGLALAHLRYLRYLDHKHLVKAEVDAARQRHQDTVAEFKAQDAQEAASVAAAKEATALTERLRAAHVEGVATLLEDATKADQDWAKLAGIPGMLEGWPELLTRLETGTQDFQGQMLEQREKREGEEGEMGAGAQQVTAAQEDNAAQTITEFAKTIKKAIRETQMDGESKPTAKAELLAANKQLSQKLVAWEVEAAHDVLEMAEQLESELGKMGDACQPILASCFAMIRKQLAEFWVGLNSNSVVVLERYAAGDADLDSLPEASRDIVRDKEAVATILSACEERQWAHVDTVLAQLTANLQDELSTTVAQKRAWANERKRQRLTEIIHLCEGNEAVIQEKV